MIEGTKGSADKVAIIVRKPKPKKVVVVLTDIAPPG
jgi:hypothetical protein